MKIINGNMTIVVSHYIIILCVISTNIKSDWIFFYKYHLLMMSVFCFMDDYFYINAYFLCRYPINIIECLTIN